MPQTQVSAGRWTKTPRPRRAGDVSPLISMQVWCDKRYGSIRNAVVLNTIIRVPTYPARPWVKRCF